VIEGTLSQHNYVSECFRLESRDLEKTGRPQVILVYGVGEFDIHTSRRSGGSGGPNECWLAVLAGSSGKLLWKERIGGYHFDSEAIKCPKSVALAQPAYADLNGDGVEDVIVLAQVAPAGPRGAPGSTSNDTAHEIRALDGHSGSLLWKYPLGEKQVSALIAGPVQGDGSVDILVASSELIAVDGKDGRQKWAWSPPPNLRWYSPRDIRGYTPQVLADLDGTGRRSICLTMQGAAYDSKDRQIFVLDPPGKVRCTLGVILAVSLSLAVSSGTSRYGTQLYTLVSLSTVAAHKNANSIQKMPAE
jgi:hypothetical protein